MSWQVVFSTPGSLSGRLEFILYRSSGSVILSVSNRGIVAGSAETAPSLQCFLPIIFSYSLVVSFGAFIVIFSKCFFRAVSSFTLSKYNEFFGG